MELDKINIIRLLIIYIVSLCITGHYFIKNNKNIAKLNKTPFGSKELFETLLVGAVASLMITFVFFIYFDFLPNSGPSSCQLNEEVCGVYRG